MFWKSMNALACSVNKLISLDLGAQLTSTSGKDLRPSSWFSSCDSNTYRGAFSGNSTRTKQDPQVDQCRV